MGRENDRESWDAQGIRSEGTEAKTVRPSTHHFRLETVGQLFTSHSDIKVIQSTCLISLLMLHVAPMAP